MWDMDGEDFSEPGRGGKWSLRGRYGVAGDPGRGPPGGVTEVALCGQIAGGHCGGEGHHGVIQVPEGPSGGIRTRQEVCCWVGGYTPALTCGSTEWGLGAAG